LKDNLAENLRSENLEDLKLPLYIAAANLNTGRVVYFNQGNIVERIQASAAIPILFEPVEIDGQVYIDGGMLDNFPVEPIKDQCSKLIGISLNPVREEEDFKNLIRIAERTFRLSTSSDISRKKKLCDIVLEPEELAEYGLLDVSSGKEMFDLGYRTAKKQLNT
jgi:NTE family protein